MDSSRRPSQDDPVQVVASNLRVDAATADVTAALAAAGIPSILLKGPSIGRWLYSPEEPRGYSDSDLLVDPGDMTRAEQVLAALGFTRRYDIEGLPEWWDEHAHEWWRADDGVWVDLHQTLAGTVADGTTVWNVLRDQTESMEVARREVRVLAPAARALHVALHAAQHGEAWGKAIPDVERAVERLDLEVWEAAAGLAGELEATDALGAGLRLTPAGADLAARLGLPANRSVEGILRAGSPPPVAIGLARLAEAGSFHARAAMVARKAVPPPGFIRHWYPPAQRGRLWLALGYVYRPIWLMLGAARALRAWRAARERAKQAP